MVDDELKREFVILDDEDVRLRVCCAHVRVSVREYISNR
jgi:hypothetical protein